MMLWEQALGANVQYGIASAAYEKDKAAWHAQRVEMEVQRAKELHEASIKRERVLRRREHANAALAGIMARGINGTAEEAAEACYDIADAMMAEEEKRGA